MRVRQLPIGTITHYTVIKRYNGYTYMAFQLETGRTHQIRLHMKHLGYPLVGDPLYNPDSNYSDGLLLHAAAIQLPIPFTNDVKSVGAPLPPTFPRNLRK